MTTTQDSSAQYTGTVSTAPAGGARAAHMPAAQAELTMRITPSILNCDLTQLGEELRRIESTPTDQGADGVHVDVMDNHFVPNISWGLAVTESVCRTTSLPIDAHLMIENPDRWAPEYAEIGCHTVTPHIEACAAPIRLARDIHSRGARMGMALKPATPLSAVDYLLADIDLLLIMTVEPGFGGQSFIEEMLPKIAAARDLVGRSGQQIIVQVDGGISARTIERAAEAGADTFVAGSAVYQAEDALRSITELRRLASAHQH